MRLAPSVGAVGFTGREQSRCPRLSGLGATANAAGAAVQAAGANFAAGIKRGDGIGKTAYYSAAAAVNVIPVYGQIASVIMILGKAILDAIIDPDFDQYEWAMADLPKAVLGGDNSFRNTIGRLRNPATAANNFGAKEYPPPGQALVAVYQIQDLADDLSPTVGDVRGGNANTETCDAWAFMGSGLPYGGGTIGYSTGQACQRASADQMKELALYGWPSTGSGDSLRLRRWSHLKNMRKLASARLHFREAGGYVTKPNLAQLAAGVLPWLPEGLETYQAKVAAIDAAALASTSPFGFLTAATWFPPVPNGVLLAGGGLLLYLLLEE